MRLIDAGHTPWPAEQWASHLPAFQGADPAVLLAFAEADARHWQEVRAHEPASDWKRRMAASAVAWRDHRRGPAE